MATLFIKQMLAGRDFARHNPVAGQMQNFVYLLGDSDTRECVVVDPAWAVDDLLDEIERLDYSLVGALVTHYHPDHIGGTMFGFTVEGAARLLARKPVPIHVHRDEAHGVRVVTGLSQNDLTPHDSGDKVRVGDVEIELLHTPGHTPGSQCFRVGQALVAGDTLFLQGCGRVDLPGGDVDQMYQTLTQRLASLPADTVLYPGHAYGGSHADLGTVRRTNPYLRVPSLEAWRRMMG